jgi:hypothetical protein
VLSRERERERERESTYVVFIMLYQNYGSYSCQNDVSGSTSCFPTFETSVVAISWQIFVFSITYKYKKADLCSHLFHRPKRGRIMLSKVLLTYLTVSPANTSTFLLLFSVIKIHPKPSTTANSSSFLHPLHVK